jgi:hypothetical protein
MLATFAAMIEAIRTDDVDAVAALCAPECIAHVSTVGTLIGPAAIAEGLCWPGPATAVSKATIWNFVARSDEARAVQTADVQWIRATDDGRRIHPFLWGLQWFAEMAPSDDGWRFTTIRADLAYEAGNSGFVRGAWTLMDYDEFAGHAPAISPVLDNPWRLVPVDAEPQTDEEQVFELMFKYAYAFDNGDFDFLHSFVTADFFINGGSVEKPYPRGPLDAGDLVGLREVSDFLRSKFHKEAKMMHACRMGAIELDGDVAVAWMPRGEEHRLRGLALTAENVDSAFTTAVHKLVARRDATGAWRLARYRIEPTLRADPVPSGTVLFDEFIDQRVVAR